MEASRRRFFRILAALGAAPVLDRVAALLPETTAEQIGLVAPRSSLYAELAAITRKALIPRIYTQHREHPLLARFNCGNDDKLFMEITHDKLRG